MKNLKIWDIKRLKFIISEAWGKFVTGKSNNHLVFLALIIFLHMLLLSRLIFFPYPELFVYSYLTKAGLVPYRDILDQHFPGIMFFDVNLATVGIDTPAEMRLLQYLLVIVTHLILFKAANLIFNSNKKSLLVNFIYFVWQPFFEGYVLWIDSFAAPLLALAYYFLLKAQNNKKYMNLFIIGVILGFSLLLKQVVAPLVIASSILVWVYYKDFKALEKYTLGMSVPAIILVLFLIKNNNLGDFFYWTVTFNLTTFAEMGRKFPSWGEIVKSSIFFGLPLLFAFYSFFSNKLKVSKNLIITSVFYICSLAFAYARFDYVHLQPAIPFAAILIVVLLSQLSSYKYSFYLTFIFLATSIVFTASEYRYLLGSRVLFYDNEENAVAENVSSLTESGDTVFAFGTFPHIYQMTNTLPPGNVFVFQFPWFMKKAEQRIYKGLITDKPKVVLRDKDAQVAGVNLTQYMATINNYISKYYKTIETVGTTEIMIPN